MNNPTSCTGVYWCMNKPTSCTGNLQKTLLLKAFLKLINNTELLGKGFIKIEIDVCCNGRYDKHLFQQGSSL